MFSFKSMVVLSMVGLLDAISYMAVAPSLIFYVMEAGGSKELYGVIMSVFSFASFCAKPLYGIWVDRNGNKFRVPYCASLAAATVGALLYFAASFSPSSRSALAMILTGRLLGGLGAANQALGFAYIATTVPPEQQTRTNSILAVTRVFGMTTGPVVNVLLAKVDWTVDIGNTSIHLDPLNSVGLLLAAGNLSMVAMVYFLLGEPEEKKDKKNSVGVEDSRAKGSVWNAMLSFDVLLPLLILFVANAAFQLVETALPPAAADGLGWGPVQTSAVLGGSSILLSCSMVLTVVLSGTVPDRAMVAFGTVSWLFGSLGIWLFWKRDVAFWYYVVPVAIGFMGFPFIVPANRTNYTRAIKRKPALEGSVALMQSVLSMAASVAGFVTPGFVATFVVRSQDEISASGDMRELTPIALLIPVLAILGLVGLWHEETQDQQEPKAGEPQEPNEASALLPREERRTSEAGQDCSRASEVTRRPSGQMMGVADSDTFHENQERESLRPALDDIEEQS